MDPTENAAVYDRIAEHWASDAFEATNGVAQHERALRFAPGSGAALDVGCGANGRLIDLLRRHGYQVEGLDHSTRMLEFARRRHPEVTFHHADIRVWPFERRYAFISAWDSLWHVPLADQIAVLKRICDGLAPDGVLVFSAGGLDAPGEVTNPCHGQPLYHATPGVPQLLRAIEAAGCVCRHLEYDQLPEKHVYFVVQKAQAGA
ncbi:dTDP-3-amino-3,6-dideoxy-alpha-D-glucopyranose N,N-dimethyltransferase [Planctomycetes bacterium MalM25]|nr:dTDP-3-amino-3,6-dideoxy-alpha-D-glucopyranose N,N-dimethyltransferase [Planctomycetes bacterium MalM25]